MRHEVAGDNRLRLRLTPGQLAALQRAVILADRSDLATRLGVRAGTLPQGLGSAVLPHEESAELDLALQALRLRSRIRFRYKGTRREVHPGAVRFQHVQWYLSGVEVGDDLVKHFAVGRMSEVSLAEPGSAETLEEIRRLRLHPLEWRVDEPTEGTLSGRPSRLTYPSGRPRSRRSFKPRARPSTLNRTARSAQQRHAEAEQAHHRGLQRHRERAEHHGQQHHRDQHHEPDHQP